MQPLTAERMLSHLVLTNRCVVLSVQRLATRCLGEAQQLLQEESRKDKALQRLQRPAGHAPEEELSVAAKVKRQLTLDMNCLADLCASRLGLSPSEVPQLLQLKETFSA
ncbi:hypothetical protein cyc_08790 [Cyclospora cayetanensis]|uniref:Uncharacterized protein n=1 Tax=Cyclospora cayetanensis TaxID=88456 RepID=A0A1D3D020_9EIME|nr:hypothetical protein cyc_08790 [Cyclospora cayetanensis]